MVRDMYKLLINKIPDLLETSYQLNHPNDNQDSWFKSFKKFSLFLSHSYELIRTVAGIMPEEEKNILFSKNKALIQKEFANIAVSNNDSGQKHAAYFVSSYDHNGAMLGTVAMLNHFHEIKNLQEYGYTVYPMVVDNFFQISYRSEKAELVVINAHGDPSYIWMDHFTVDLNLTFNTLKKGADIVLISCSTASGLESSIAAKIAKDNLGSNVFGAEKMLWAANINFGFDDKNNATFVKNVEYQPGIYIYDAIVPTPSVEIMNKFIFNDEVSSAVYCVNKDILFGDNALEEMIV
jgi:phage gpG-like protein